MKKNRIKIIGRPRGTDDEYDSTPSYSPVSLVYVSDLQQNYMALLTYELRKERIYCEIQYDMSFKKQMKKAGKLQSCFVLIVGEEEIKNDNITVKNYETGEQKKVESKDLVSYLKNQIEIRYEEIMKEGENQPRVSGGWEDQRDFVREYLKNTTRMKKSGLDPEKRTFDELWKLHQ